MEGDNEMNDADMQMARCTSVAKGLANARKAGHCSHEKREMRVGSMLNDEPPYKTTCLDCGKVGTWAELDEDRREILIEWT